MLEALYGFMDEKAAVMVPLPHGVDPSKSSPQFDETSFADAALTEDVQSIDAEPSVTPAGDEPRADQNVAERSTESRVDSQEALPRGQSSTERPLPDDRSPSAFVTTKERAVEPPATEAQPEPAPRVDTANGQGDQGPDSRLDVIFE